MVKIDADPNPFRSKSVVKGASSRLTNSHHMPNSPKAEGRYSGLPSIDVKLSEKIWNMYTSN